MGLNRDNITTTPIDRMRNDIRAYFGSMAAEIDIDAFAQDAIKDYTEFCDIPAEQITAYGTAHDRAVDYLDTEDIGDPIVPATHARAMLGHMLTSQQLHEIKTSSGTTRAVTLTVDQLGGLVAEILSELSVSDHKVQRVIESYLSRT